MGSRVIPAVILIALIAIPAVSAMELSCQKVLPPKPTFMYCNLTGQGNISVRIVAFDNVPISRSLRGR